MMLRINPGSEKHEHTFKVLVIGDVGTGKTSFIKRYISKLFSIHYKATIGTDLAVKELNWDDNTTITLQLWDIAGQERFGSMTRVYYRDAIGAFVVFDVTRASTFEAVEKWKDDLDSKAFLPNGYLIPAVLLANKCDQESLFKNEKIDKLCSDKGFSKWFETSAKENIGIDDAINYLLTTILECKKDLTESEPGIVSPGNDQPQSSPCCSLFHKESKSSLLVVSGQNN